MEELSILELASKGGWIMIVLAVLSVIAVYIFVERFLAIRNAGKDDKLFMDRIRDYIKNGDVKSGQAMNYGNIYETEYGFIGGKSFGLTIAALGFLSASIGGVIHLNILKRKGKIKCVSCLNKMQKV